MNRKQKLTFFIPVIKIGGAEKVYVEISKLFSSLGYNVEILTLRNKAADKYNLKNLKVVSLNKSRLIYSFFGILMYLKKRNPNFFFSTLNHSNILTLFIKLFVNKNIKFIIREANTPSLSLGENFFLKKFIFKFLISFFYPFADKIISVSDGVKNDLIKNFNIKDDLIYTISNPINKKEIINRSNYLFEKNFDHISFSPYFVCVGSLSNQKNHKFLLSTLKELIKLKKCNLLIIGSGKNYNNLIKFTSKFKILNNVKFIGNINNPYPYMKYSKGMILPSLWEGLPNVLIEGLCLDIPIIASNCSEGVRNILKEGQLGHLFNINDQKKLIQILSNVLDSKSKIKKDKDILRYDNNKIINQYIDLLKNLYRNKN